MDKKSLGEYFFKYQGNYLVQATSNHRQLISFFVTLNLAFYVAIYQVSMGDIWTLHQGKVGFLAILLGLINIGLLLILYREDHLSGTINGELKALFVSVGELNDAQERIDNNDKKLRGGTWLVTGSLVSLFTALPFAFSITLFWKNSINGDLLVKHSGFLILVMLIFTLMFLLSRRTGGDVVNVKWITLLALFGIWLAFTIGYSMWFIVIPPGSTRFFETTKFVFLSIAAFGVLSTLLLSTFNSIETSINVKEKIYFDKIENAFEFIAKWDSPSLKDARDMTRKLKSKRQKISDDELIRKIEGPFSKNVEKMEQENLKRSVITMFNFFEEISLSFKYKRVEEQVLKDGFRDIFIDIYERFKPWLENERYMSKLQLEHLKKLKSSWE